MSVYFVQVGEDGPIKIGRSDDVERRIAALQTTSPAKLRLLAEIPGDSAEESELHRRFAEVRLEGEWFRPTVALCAHICNAAGAFPVGSMEVLSESVLQRFTRAEINELTREMTRSEKDPQRLPPLTAEERASARTIDFSGVARLARREHLEGLAARVAALVEVWPAGESAEPHVAHLRLAVQHLGAKAQGLTHGEAKDEREAREAEKAAEDAE